MLEKQGVVTMVDGQTLTIVGERFERFDIDEYIGHPAMVAKLYRERQIVLEECNELKNEVRTLQSELNYAKLAIQSLKFEIDEAKRRSSLNIVLAIMATVLVGIGVNLATAMPYDMPGWVMIVVGCILQLIASLRSRK